MTKKIHFICRGNTFRSRVAQAYGRSILAGNTAFDISSSGIEANEDLFGPIDPKVREALERNNLLKYSTPNWLQTTQAFIDNADTNVFMNNDVYEDAKKLFNLPKNGLVIWQIPDIGESSLNRTEIINKIETQVRQLLEKL